VIQGGDRLWLVQKSLFNSVKEAYVCLERTTSVLQAGAPSTLFSCENWVSYRIKTKLKEHMYSSNNTSLPITIVSCALLPWELCKLFYAYFLTLAILKWEKHSLCPKRNVLLIWQNWSISWNISICVRRRRVSTLLTFENSLCFWKESSLSLNVFMWGNHSPWAQQLYSAE
jgi:hypothetical protein